MSKDNIGKRFYVYSSLKTGEFYGYWEFFTEELLGKVIVIDDFFSNGNVYSNSSYAQYITEEMGYFLDEKVTSSKALEIIFNGGFIKNLYANRTYYTKDNKIFYFSHFVGFEYEEHISLEDFLAIDFYTCLPYGYQESKKEIKKGNLVRNTEDGTIYLVININNKSLSILNTHFNISVDFKKSYEVIGKDELIQNEPAYSYFLNNLELSCLKSLKEGN